jgi:hypothetical protein
VTRRYRRRPTTLALTCVVVVAACSSSSHRSSSSSAATAPSPPAANVRLVGTYKGHPGRYQTIQSAVDAAKPGDWVLVAPGDYHEQYDHAAPVGPKVLGGVYITTPQLHLRGMDRNTVIVDGTKPGAPQCSRAPGDQDLGPVDSTAKPIGRNGVEVWKADGGSVDNLSVCNFLTGSKGGGNEIWWNGGDGSGVVGMGAYNGSYLSATTTYVSGDTTASYGIFVSNSGGPGLVAHSYASNMSDAGYYIGACADCNAIVDDAHAQFSALGYSGTNSGGHLIVKNSEFDQNKTGFTTNSQNNDDAPSPQDGACPNNGVGPTGTHSCWVFENNYVHDNNNPNVPGHGTAELGWPGGGLIIAGGRNDTVVNNRFENNASWAVSVVPFPDTGTPPLVAHCVGGDPNGVPALGLKGCFYISWGNEVAHNTFKNNGSYGNPTNGDLADVSDTHTPGNCWHDNTDPAGVTSAPPNLQQTNATCGVAGAGASVTSSLTAQLVCASELLASCPAKPGMSYPRLTHVVLPPLTSQPTMPDPCAGVPANPWCTTQGPVSSSVSIPGLIGLIAAPAASAFRRRRAGT